MIDKKLEEKMKEKVKLIKEKNPKAQIDYGLLLKGVINNK